MGSDSAFYIGTTHKVCEDYAVSEDNIIIISDGCSSSPNTDIGSRVVCECMKRYNEKNITMTLANNIISTMYVPKRCLDVTLLTAFEKENKIIVETIGDGNITFKTKDGIMHVLSMKYAKSAPYYMSYMYNEDNDKAWGNIPDNDYTVEYSTIKHIGKTNGENNHFIETHSTMFDIPNCDFNLSRKGNKLYFEKKNIEWVALSSDGLNSFYERVETETSVAKEPVWYINVIIELLKINNTKGQFVQRRINKFKKTCIKNNWHNADDVSLAILAPGD